MNAKKVKAILTANSNFYIIEFLNKNNNIQSSLDISNNCLKFKKNINMPQAASIHTFSSNSSFIDIKKEKTISIENLHHYVIDTKKDDYKNNKGISRFARQGMKNVFFRIISTNKARGNCIIKI